MAVIKKYMDAAAELGRNPVSKHQIQPEYGEEQAYAGRASRETTFSGANADREILIFPVQLTTSRIGNLTRLIHTLLYVMTIHTYSGGRSHRISPPSFCCACFNFSLEKHSAVPFPTI